MLSCCGAELLLVRVQQESSSSRCMEGGARTDQMGSQAVHLRTSLTKVCFPTGNNLCTNGILSMEAVSKGPGAPLWVQIPALSW